MALAFWVANKDATEFFSGDWIFMYQHHHHHHHLYHVGMYHSRNERGKRTFGPRCYIPRITEKECVFVGQRKPYECIVI